MEIYTIGFTKKTAARFFGLVRDAGIKRLIDIRLRNTSQLAGFAKYPDIDFFLREICGAEYIHIPELAPTQAILDPTLTLSMPKSTWGVRNRLSTPSGFRHR